MEQLVVFEKLLKIEGYKASSIYARALGNVLENNKIDLQELLDNIGYYIYAYEYGDKRGENYGHKTVSSALKKFRNYFANGFEINVRFFDNEPLSKEDYLFLKESFNAEEHLQDYRIKIREIKQGSISLVIQIIGGIITIIDIVKIILEIFALIDNSRKILRNKLECIDRLSNIDRLLLKPFINILLKRLNKKEQDYLELTIKKEKRIITKELLEEISKRLED